LSRFAIVFKSQRSLFESKREAKLFLSCFRLEKVVLNPLELFAGKLARNVLLNNLVDRQVKLLRILWIRQ